MSHIPLLSVDIATTTTNNNKTTNVSSCDHLTPITLLQSSTAFEQATYIYNANVYSSNTALNSALTKNHRFNKPWIKVSQTITLSRMRAKSLRKIHQE